jgi:hypothetical protein
MESASICVRAMVAIQLFGVAHAQNSRCCTAGSCRIADHHWTDRGGAYAGRLYACSFGMTNRAVCCCP